MKQIHDPLYEDLKSALQRSLNEVMVSGLKNATRLNPDSGKFELHQDYVSRTLIETELILFETVAEIFQDIKVTVYDSLNQYTDILMRAEKYEDINYSKEKIDLAIEEIEKNIDKEGKNE